MRKFLDQLGIKAHLTISDGTPTQNVLYCTKDNHDLLTYGTLSTVSQAKKKTAECVSEMIKNGAPLKRVAEEHPEYYMRSHRGIAALYAILKAPDDHDVPRDFKTEVRVYIGPTGTGKSREAHEKDQIQWTHPGDRWFDGYQGQERVLFDDFEGVTSGITYRKLLQITDRYPNPVPVKGGFANWRPRLIIFTTNVHPSKWYPDQDWPTIQRRIDEIRFFDP